MTTFTTRNQSRKNIYFLLIAGTLMLLLVTIIVLIRRHRYQEMFKGYDQNRYNNNHHLHHQHHLPHYYINNINEPLHRSRTNDNNINNQSILDLRNSSENKSIKFNKSDYNNSDADIDQNQSSSNIKQHSNILHNHLKPFYDSKTVLRTTSIVNILHNGGPVRGQIRLIKSSSDVYSKTDTSAITTKVVSSFLGIPYAAPPVNDLRFEPPKSALTWTKIKNAIYQVPKCPQVRKF